MNKEIVIMTELCERYAQDPSEDNGTMMLGSILKLDQDLDSIKQSVAGLVNKVDKEVIEISQKNNGYIIKS